MIISDEAFEYLKWQAGDIYDLHTDRAKWQAAYEAKLEAQFENIAPWLPQNCRLHVLDIGSGLGGIDAVLNSLVPGGIYPYLMDGFEGDPQPVFSDTPHNDMNVAKRFLRENGVPVCKTISVRDPQPIGFNLVISFAAWCFHIQPLAYFDYVALCCMPGSVVILDVRRNRPEWDLQLASRFVEVAVIHEAPKFQRKVFALAA